MATFNELETALKTLFNNLPRLIGNEAVRFFKEQMRNEVDVNGNAYTRRTYETDIQQGKRTLSDRGNLEASIEILSINGNKVTVGVNSDVIAYAEIHNEGGKIQVTAKMKRYFWSQQYRAKRRNLDNDADFYKRMALKKEGSDIKIPKREFIGDSRVLQQRLNEVVKQEVEAVLSRF